MDFDQTQVVTFDSSDDENVSGQPTKLELKIVGNQQSFSENTFPLIFGENVIGRDISCGVHIDSKALSRSHAAIFVHKDGQEIYDLGSRNKTRRGKLFLKPNVHYELKLDEVICFGNIEAKVVASINDNVSETDSNSLLAANDTVDNTNILASDSDCTDIEDCDLAKQHENIIPETPRVEVPKNTFSSQQELVECSDDDERPASSLLLECPIESFGSDSEESDKSSTKKNIALANTLIIAEDNNNCKVESVTTDQSILASHDLNLKLDQSSTNECPVNSQGSLYDDEKDSVSKDRGFDILPTKPYFDIDSKVKDDDGSTVSENGKLNVYPDCVNDFSGEIKKKSESSAHEPDLDLAERKAKQIDVLATQPYFDEISDEKNVETPLSSNKTDVLANQPYPNKVPHGNISETHDPLATQVYSEKSGNSSPGEAEILPTQPYIAPGIAPQHSKGSKQTEILATQPYPNNILHGNSCETLDPLATQVYSDKSGNTSPDEAEILTTQPYFEPGISPQNSKSSKKIDSIKVPCGISNESLDPLATQAYIEKSGNNSPDEAEILPTQPYFAPEVSPQNSKSSKQFEILATQPYFDESTENKNVEIPSVKVPSDNKTDILATQPYPMKFPCGKSSQSLDPLATQVYSEKSDYCSPDEAEILPTQPYFVSGVTSQNSNSSKQSEILATQPYVDDVTIGNQKTRQKKLKNEEIADLLLSSQMNIKNSSEDSNLSPSGNSEVAKKSGKLKRKKLVRSEDKEPIKSKKEKTSAKAVGGNSSVRNLQDDDNEKVEAATTRIIKTRRTHSNGEPTDIDVIYEPDHAEEDLKDVAAMKKVPHTPNSIIKNTQKSRKRKSPRSKNLNVSFSAQDLQADDLIEDIPEAATSSSKRTLRTRNSRKKINQEAENTDDLMKENVLQVPEGTRSREKIKTKDKLRNENIDGTFSDAFATSSITKPRRTLRTRKKLKLEDQADKDLDGCIGNDSPSSVAKAIQSSDKVFQDQNLVTEGTQRTLNTSKDQPEVKTASLAENVLEDHKTVTKVLKVATSSVTRTRKTQRTRNRQKISTEESFSIEKVQEVVEIVEGTQSALYTADASGEDMVSESQEAISETLLNYDKSSKGKKRRAINKNSTPRELKERLTCLKRRKDIVRGYETCEQTPNKSYNNEEPFDGASPTFTAVNKKSTPKDLEERLTHLKRRKDLEKNKMTAETSFEATSPTVLNDRTTMLSDVAKKNIFSFTDNTSSSDTDRAKHQKVPTKHSTRKRKNREIEDEESKSDEFKSPSKRFSLPPTSKIKVMFTGLANSTQNIKIVESLGGKVTEHASDCSILVSDKFKRTVKTLCCVAQGKPIVSVSWLNKCKKLKTFVDACEHLLQDKDAEKMFNFDLKLTLELASKKPLLTGFKIHVTDGVKPPPSEMKDIIASAGGKFLLKSPAKIDSNTVAISCKEDCFTDFKCPAVSNEFLLTGLLRYDANTSPYLLTQADESICKTRKTKHNRKVL